MRAKYPSDISPEQFEHVRPLLERALKKSGWRGPRETGAQRMQRLLDRGRTERKGQ